MWPGVILITTPELSVLDYDNIELYEYQSKSYALCHNDNCDDLHLFVLQEYDLINNEFTKKYWNNRYGYKYESYTVGGNKISVKIDRCFDVEFPTRKYAALIDLTADAATGKPAMAFFTFKGGDIIHNVITGVN